MKREEPKIDLILESGVNYIAKIKRAVRPSIGEMFWCNQSSEAFRVIDYVTQFKPLKQQEWLILVEEERYPRQYGFVK